MNIDSIKNGFVIDHIKAGQGMTVYRLLNLEALDVPVAMIMNAASAKMGRKDIIKIDAQIPVDLDALGYIDPDITVNIIRDGTLAEKKHLELPERVVGVIKCKNPRCITTTEQELPHIFKLTNRAERIYRCYYCEAKAK